MGSMDSTQNVVLADAAQLIERLDALQSGKRQQKTALFQKLYPAIERALAREVPQKTIIAQLTSMGLPLSMGGFRSLLETERKQRAEKGEYLHCECCGSILPASTDALNAGDNVTLASLAPRNEARRGQSN